MRIALVAKYVNADSKDVFIDAYASIVKALRHAGNFCSRKVNIRFINSEHLERVKNGMGRDKYEAAWKELRECQ